MTRPPVSVLWYLLLGVAVLLTAFNGCGGGSASSSTPPPPPPPPLKIQHVVVIFQENRNPDNLFQQPKLIAAGADIQNIGINSLGDRIPLTPLTLAANYDPF